MRAFAYIRAHGGPGLRQVSDDAVLAANYLRARVGEAYELPFDGPCKHEFVASAQAIREETGVRTLDIAKRLIDHGFHPPTIYFPLIVEECLLIEPTETESLETLDAFADALIAVAEEARRDPELLRRRPARCAGAPARRGDGRPPAGPALAAPDRRSAALPDSEAPGTRHRILAARPGRAPARGARQAPGSSSGRPRPGLPAGSVRLPGR